MVKYLDKTIDRFFRTILFEDKARNIAAIERGKFVVRNRENQIITKAETKLFLMTNRILRERLEREGIELKFKK